MRSLALLLALTSPLQAAQWLHLHTPHFELLTTAGEKRGREVIQHFEEIRSFFLTAAPAQKIPEFPVRIISFGSAKEYAPYAPNGAAAAYYTQSHYRDYIVMQESAGEHFATVTHEYMHLLSHYSGVALPLWLNEGWADVYSTLHNVGNKAVIGEAIPARVQKLRTETWMSIQALAAVDHDSPVYNEKNRAGIFYSQSWALTHMLLLSPEYRPRLNSLIAAFKDGLNTAEAFQRAYGKTEDQMFAELQAYLNHATLQTGIIDAKLERPGQEPEIRTASPYESAIILADLLSATRRRDESRRAFLAVEKQFPGRPETAKSLGYLELRSGDDRTAREYFAKAFAAGESDPEMCVDLAMLLIAAHADDEDIRPALTRALKARPDYVEARMQLGYLELRQQNYPKALEVFSSIGSAPPQHAAALFGGRAVVNYSMGDIDAARTNAEQARRLATAAADIERAEHILRSIENKLEGERLATERSAQLRAARAAAPPPPPPPTQEAEVDVAPLRQYPPPEPERQRLEGTAIAFDCAKDGAKFRMRRGAETLTFAFDDPGKVMLRHGGKVVYDFTCGPQKSYPVVVEYDPAPAGVGLTGYIRLLEF